ncbi:MAG: hypothetical protein LAQ69_23805 [Acidobacteriia bacterium]|nr:hypothetical protein [Terriglobia bacterium]
MKRTSSAKLILAVSLFATSCEGQDQQTQQAKERDKLRNSLNVNCSVSEKQTPAFPNVRGTLQFDVTLELANTGSDRLHFNDDMILVDGSPEQDSYTGAYAVYHKTGSSGGVFGSDYYDRAHNYVIANHNQYWPEGGMAGFLDGGTHQKSDYKAPAALCNTMLASGAKATYSTSMSQGVWLKRELSSRVLVVLPEITVARTATASPSRYRIILTMTRADASSDRWGLKDKSVVLLETGSLKRLLTTSQADLPMRVFALNWLAEVDREAAAPFILQTLKQRQIGKNEFVASVQLLGHYRISPDGDALQAIKDIAGDESTKNWGQMAAARYLQENVAKTTTAQPR